MAALPTTRNPSKPSGKGDQLDLSEALKWFSPLDSSSHPGNSDSDDETPSPPWIAATSEGGDTMVYTQTRTCIQEVAVSDPMAQADQTKIQDDDPLPSLEERAEATRQSLREKGYILNEDARGLRLSGISTRGSKPMSDLSPYDVVRLAADLEGGLLPPDQRKHCPKCDAVVLPSDKRCQWCSEPL